jgi:hypothetical protein
MVMGLEAAYDALVHRLEVSHEIGCKILNTDILKTIRNNMSRELCIVPIVEAQLWTCLLAKGMRLLSFPDDERFQLF